MRSLSVASAFLRSNGSAGRDVTGRRAHLHIFYKDCVGCRSFFEDAPTLSRFFGRDSLYISQDSLRFFHIFLRNCPNSSRLLLAWVRRSTGFLKRPLICSSNCRRSSTHASA